MAYVFSFFVISISACCPKKTVGFKASPARFELLLLAFLSKLLALKPFLLAAQPLLIAVFTQMFTL